MNRGKQRTDNQWHSMAEWYTPTWLMERVQRFLGAEWWDACPASYGKIEESTLYASWAGKRVYCNPPYGAAIVPWITKAMTEPAREVVLLVPAYTGAKWFKPIYVCDLCFIHGRLYFRKLGGEPSSRSPHDSVLAYRGRRHKAFADAFQDIGPVLRVYRGHKWGQETLL